MLRLMRDLEHQPCVKDGAKSKFRDTETQRQNSEEKRDWRKNYRDFRGFMPTKRRERPCRNSGALFSLELTDCNIDNNKC